MKNFINDPAARRWAYGVGAALLVVLGGYGVIDSTAEGNLNLLIASVLNVAPAAALGLAARKTSTQPSDTAPAVVTATDLPPAFDDAEIAVIELPATAE